MKSRYIKNWRANPAIRTASFGQRLLSGALDAVLLGWTFHFFFQFSSIATQPVALAFTINAMICFGYFAGLPKSKMGATPGQFLLGLLIVDDQTGKPVEEGRYVMRTFYKMGFILPFLMFYYFLWPFMLTDRYELREGTERIHEKLAAHRALTPAEQKRWDNFQVNVQQPVNRMYMASLRFSGLLLAVNLLFMASNAQRRAFQDVLSRTLVVKRKDSVPESDSPGNF